MTTDIKFISNESFPDSLDATFRPEKDNKGMLVIRNELENKVYEFHACVFDTKSEHDRSFTYSVNLGKLAQAGGKTKIVNINYDEFAHVVGKDPSRNLNAEPEHFTALLKDAIFHTRTIEAVQQRIFKKHILLSAIWRTQEILSKAIEVLLPTISDQAVKRSLMEFLWSHTWAQKNVVKYSNFSQFNGKSFPDSPKQILAEVREKELLDANEIIEEVRSWPESQDKDKIIKALQDILPRIVQASKLI